MLSGRGATCSKRTVAPVLRASAPTASTMLSAGTALSSGTRMRFAMTCPSCHALARTRLAAMYFFGCRFESRAISRIRRNRRSSLASPASKASRDVLAMSSTRTGGRRASRTSSVQRVASPPFGPFSSVNATRALVGSTGIGSSTPANPAATRARNPRVATLPQKSILASVMTLSSVGEPDLACEYPPALAERVTKQQESFGVDAEHPPPVSRSFAPHLDPATGEDVPIAPRGQQRGVPARAIDLDPGGEIIEQLGSEHVAIDVAPGEL